jgi:hypothetical protein
MANLLEHAARIAIEDFARFLGLPVRFNDQDQCAFDFSESGRLSFTVTPDKQSVLLTLSKDLPRGMVDFSRLLSIAGYDPVQRITVQTSINRANQYVLSARCAQRDLSVQRIIQLFDFFKSLQKRF